MKLKISRRSLGINGEEEYNVLKFSAYFGNAKFTGDESDLLGKLE